MSTRTVKSVEDFMAAVREDSAEWPGEQPRWFRGEPESETPLVPSLYRNNTAPPENQLLQMFRLKAPAFSSENLPDRKNTDQWLFLAQHVGLPTRLIDWSESALIGLYFALKEEKPVVWMLNPLHLNHFANNLPCGEDPNTLREFPVPWFRPKEPPYNVAAENLAGAWENDRPGVALPVAVYPTYVHGRLRAQRGCFTIHGKKKESLKELVPSTILRRYRVKPSRRERLLRDLFMMGVTESVAFPDLDGLARELKQRFFDEII